MTIFFIYAVVKSTVINGSFNLGILGKVRNLNPGNGSLYDNIIFDGNKKLIDSKVLYLIIL